MLSEEPGVVPAPHAAVASPWIQTFSGKRFYPLDPQPEQIDIVDIAHALSHACRFAGHCAHHYSVAQHSLLVSQHVPAEFALWGLMHDAAEAYLGDVPRPIKSLLPAYKEAERRVQAAICARFGLPPDEPPEVKRVDTAILADERRALMLKIDVDDPEWGATEPPLGIKIEPMIAFDAKWAFIDRFGSLLEREAVARAHGDLFA